MKACKRTGIILKQMLVQITRDMMLFILSLTPVLVGVVIHFGIPALEKFVCGKFGQSQILTPYYELFDWLIAMMPGLMFAFVGALTALGEIDDKIAGYMALTPAGNIEYLMARIGIPSIVSLIADVAVLKLFQISGMGMGRILLLSACMSALGADVAFLVIAVSSNKVEGMAIGKMSGIILLGAFLPVFIQKPVQYAAAFLPSFWVGKMMISMRNPSLAMSFFVIFLLVWSMETVLLYRIYQRKLAV